MQKVYCYTNPCYLEEEISESYDILEVINKKDYKAIWYARYSYVKDVKVLFESVRKIDLLNKNIILDIRGFTNLFL